jgi:FkbM family methyltransferase
MGLMRSGIWAIVRKTLSYSRHLVYRNTFRDRVLNQKAIVRLLGEEPLVILELGAADGQDTNKLLSNLRHPDSKVYAFEPDRRNILSFKRNVIDPRAVLIEKAIGPYSGQGSLHISNTIYSSSIRKPNEEVLRSQWPEMTFDEIETVDFTTLDDAVETLGLSKIDFIWADVQGAEEDIISGGAQSLAKTRYLYSEYSSLEFYEGALTLHDLRSLLGVDWQMIKDYGSEALFRNLGN